MSLRIELIAALKRLLKAQGITYAALAKQLDLSEAAVKRMFSQQAISLARLEEICVVLDVGLSELATETKTGGPPPLAELSEETEQLLVDNPPFLLGLYLTLNRWKEDDVLARYDFTKPQWTGVLVKLDRLGVIELLPENRYRLRTARNFRWRKDGPMERFFLKRLLPEFFNRPFLNENEHLLLLSGMVSPASAAKIGLRLEEAAEEFDSMLVQDAVLPTNQRVGVSLVLAQRRWSLHLFDNLRRKPSS
ncbi:MAG: helix-turn-helix transcriptional regulator [Arenimonas sp.]